MKIIFGQPTGQRAGQPTGQPRTTGQDNVCFSLLRENT